MSTAKYPLTLSSPSGLSAQINENGSIRRMDHRDVILNLFLGNEVEGGATNLYLRSVGDPIDWTPLLGPRSPTAFDFVNGFAGHGSFAGIRFRVALVLARSAPAWFWHVAVTNERDDDATLDLVYAQDLALAPYGMVRLNEYYVSQYVDYTPLDHPEHGAVLGVRQNLSVGGRNPWALIGSLGRGVSFATDALQFHGLPRRAGGAPSALATALPGRRCQHEHSMAVIQDASLSLAPGATAHCGFFGILEEHHPAATGSEDLALVGKAVALPEAAPAQPRDGVPTTSRVHTADAATLFSQCPSLEALDLSDGDLDSMFEAPRRDVEQHEGTTLSFFTGANRHVVMRAKELVVLRPHGQIMRTGDRLCADEASLTSTAWMAGVFHSLLTQGHVSINRFLSTTHGYLGLFRSHGLRIFVEAAGSYRLLDVPSAFEASPSACRWIYKHAGGLLQVRSWAPVDRHEMNLSIEVLSGKACRFLLSHHVALNGDDGADTVPAVFTTDAGGITVKAIAECDVGRRFPAGHFRIDFGRDTAIERVTGDEALFLDGASRNQPYICVVTAPAAAVAMRITGHLIDSADTPHSTAMPLEVFASDQAAADRFWGQASGSVALESRMQAEPAREVTRIQEILPWFAHDALIHYLAPRGLEQYSGGGWGTRDVTQGPIEMMLSLGRWDAARDILVRVFKQQNPDGDWPQWFMFFERERNIRPDDSHGDIVFWPLLALAQYLTASEDGALLDEVVPFFDSAGDERAERASIWGHVERALGLIDRRVVADTSLPAYGHGDWNDSLQPLDPTMREHMCSSWTATLHYQTFRELAAALARLGHNATAARLDAAAERIREDFRRLLLVDDTLTGYAYFGPHGRIDYLLHPRDQASGVRYSVLAMIHAIIVDLLSPDEARAHVAHIRKHLLGPDGAHLFDRPFRYRGGVQKLFQRVESSTFFGREIGNMYMHAHLRYAQAMAHLGDADALFLALRQANPASVRDTVPGAALRQRNCYYSSSDPAFADRYEGFEHYERVNRGDVALQGGWRIYSSGAGIALRLVRECFLGLCAHKSTLLVDPVIPRALDGLRARLDLAERSVDVTYRVRERGCGPVTLTLNGTPLAFERGLNPYRSGAACVEMQMFAGRLRNGTNDLVVTLE